MIDTSLLALPLSPPAHFPVTVAAPRRALVFHGAAAGEAPPGHDVRTKTTVAGKLAELLGMDFIAAAADTPHSGHDERDHSPYVVPAETLPSLVHAHRLGVHGPEDLFGGVVPHAFVASKVITHPRVSSGARVPVGWSDAFARRVAHAVLPGYSVFNAGDARRAAHRLFSEGSIRLKDPAGVGGVGQWVLHSGADLESCLRGFDAARLQQHGLVLERNLEQVVTHSVGQVQAGAMRASYCGVQTLTRNHRGEAVYGGSDLLVTRGGFDALLKLRLEEPVRLAITQALCYHEAVQLCFAGFFASRCNYDVVQGVDDRGLPCSGVLEQSWRIGGASGAEVAALEAFAADPQLRTVRASTCERYGATALPPGAWVLYDDVDARVGRLVKYATVSADGHD